MVEWRTITELADEEFCYLTTTGRVSGLPREIEIWFGLDGRTLYMLSGNRNRSNWVKNLVKEPQVSVRIAGETFHGKGRIVDEKTDEDSTARKMLVHKYTRYHEGDLSEWGRTALPIAIDVKDSPD